MSPVELPVVTPRPPPAVSVPRGDAEWLRIARRARALSWVSLAWMTVEGVVGLIAGLDANALSLIRMGGVLVCGGARLDDPDLAVLRLSDAV